jgi:hypothetical protein
MSGGSPRYADQKSLVVDDFAKRLRPSLGDIAANAIENTLHPAARLGIPGDLFIPRIDLAELKVGEPSQKFLALAQRKRLHLLGDLLYTRRHTGIIAPATVVRQSSDSPQNCWASANGRDQWLAAVGLVVNQDDARESIASRGSVCFLTGPDTIFLPEASCLSRRRRRNSATSPPLASRRRRRASWISATTGSA